MPSSQLHKISPGAAATAARASCTIRLPLWSKFELGLKVLPCIRNPIMTQQPIDSSRQLVGEQVQHIGARRLVRPNRRSRPGRYTQCIKAVIVVAALFFLMRQHAGHFPTVAATEPWWFTASSGAAILIVILVEWKTFWRKVALLLSAGERFCKKASRWFDFF